MIEIAILLFILADFTRLVARLIGLDSPLHWDEAVYAVRARSWVDPGVPLSGWSYIRPPLLPIIAGIPVLAGGEEWQLRLIGLVSGLGLLTASWWLARMIAGPVAGVLAAAVLYASPTLQKESATLLTDVPAAALLVLLSGLLWHQLEERPRPRVGVVLAAVVGATAFFVRYGSVLALGPLLAVALLLWWRPLRSRPTVTLAALAIGIAAVLGHLAWSVMQTGEPLGIMLRAQSVVSEKPAGVLSFAQYERYLAMALGLISLPAVAIAAVISPAWRRPLRAGLLLVVPAMAHVFLLTRGVGHAEERFFIYSTALLVIAGCAAVALLLRRLHPAALVAGAAAVLVAVALNRGPSVDYAFQRTVALARYYTQFEAAAKAIAVVAGPDCGIVGGGDPILAWYSGCETNRLLLPADGGPPGQNLSASERWAVVFRDPKEIDRHAAVPAAIIANAKGDPLRIRDPASGREIATAWRLTPP